jgi:mycothiol synthase
VRVNVARPLAVLGFATGSRYRVTFAPVGEDATGGDGETGSGSSDGPLRALPPRERAELVALLARATPADGHPPLPEPQQRALTDADEAPPGDRVVVVREDGGDLAGAALLSPARDGSTVVHLLAGAAPGVDGRDASLRAELAARAVAAAPPGVPVHLWAMEAGPDDDARAVALGFRPERDLLQMRVPLPLTPAAVASAPRLATRPFVPGRDEEAWVDTNNRAFADHPEQGGWTVEQLRERMAAPWVELDGFLVADDPSGAGLIGSCWTKVHRDRSPVLGEIYVIAVDPRHHGHGWGRSLTVAGLESLTRRGVPVGMLYVDAGNHAAVALYRSLGFSVDHVDRSYRRDP